MNADPSETIQPWAPKMVYRARRHRSLPQTLCENFIEQQVFTFFRSYFPLGGPNYDYSPVMERATRFVLYIVGQRELPITNEHRIDQEQDLLRDDADFRHAFCTMLQNQTSPNLRAAATFQDRELTSLLKILAEVQWSGNDQVAASRAYKLVRLSIHRLHRRLADVLQGFYARDSAMVDQLVWGLTHPDAAHRGVRRDFDDPFFIAVLLIRHFKYHGGLILPPLRAARVKQELHEALLASEKALNRSTEMLFMYYPNW